MAKKKNNSSVSKKDLATAKKVAKHVAPSKSERKKIYRRSGFKKAMPYILMLFALVLAICFIIVRLAGVEDGAGVVGNYIQLFFCGLLGGAAFILPLLLGYIGVSWCIFHVNFPAADARKDSDRYDDYRRARKSVVSRTVFSSIAVYMIAVILGVFADPSTFEFAYFWESAVEDLEGGGLLGAPVAYFLTIAFQPTISLVILFILLVVVLLFSVGLTPDYIIAQIKYRRQLREEDVDFEDDYDERKIAALKEKELERARKKRKKQLEAARKQEARRLAEAEAAMLDEEVTLQPVRKAPEKKRAKAAPVSTGESVDELAADIGVADESFAEPAVENIPEPELNDIPLPSEPETRGADTAADYGGDSIIDGDSGFLALDELKSSAKPKRTPATKTLDLNEMASEEIAADLAEVLPEDKTEEEDEMVTPYVFPPVNILAPNQNPADTEREKELRETANLLQQTLKSFRVDIEAIQYSRGPTITRYELKPAVGTRVRSIANLVDDIALSLATSGVRIEAPIPNKAAVGIEVPNRIRATVYLRDLIENEKFSEAKSKLTSCLGMDVGGNPVYFDIAKMPHLLIAGATGMGKSVCINSVIISLLYKARPEDVKLILIDPKKVEFNIYKDIPHLYAPIVSDPKKAAGALASAVAEMERRFELIEEVGVRDIGTYNAVTENDPEKERMPHMVIIIDELADLMMTAPDDVESCICRLAQKARAAGIHIIIGTQRPSVDVITGLIKANIPSRIACTVASQVDSRTIIDIAGAEKLIGRGDMLFAPVGAAKPMRVQGAFVSEAEVEKIVSFIKANNSAARYNSDFISSMEENAKNCGMLGKKGAGAPASDADGGADEGGDSKFRDAVKLAVEEGKISTSLMQRRLGVGYGRAAKIIDTMEELGYVSKPDGN
ncbi:MAG: DNA translocase FtsK, partial [Clostridia bacterium]|nr:DNA translocase FtsK [Clostridia bacterium]